MKALSTASEGLPLESASNCDGDKVLSKLNPDRELPAARSSAAVLAFH
jgi:hypothetical protein